MEQIDQIYKKNENFVFRQIDDETILVPIEDNVGDMGSIYNLNEVAEFVWEHFDGEKTLGDIKDMVLKEFEVSPQDAAEDLSEFVIQLKEVEAIFEVPKMN